MAADAGELATLLGELKSRRGISYDGLAKRTGLTRSTVHRYCQGSTVPASFGPIELIGKACGATAAELAELFGCWSRAVAAAAEPDGATAEPAGPDGATAEPAEPDGATAEPAELDGAAAAPATGWRRLPARRRALQATGVLVVATAVGLTSLALDLGGPRVEHRAAGPVASPQLVEGPAWREPPSAIPPEFFGVTINSYTGAMPTFRVGAVRLWDSETRWAQLEPERGRYDWRTLDRLVGAAERASLPVLFTFGATPAWASPYGPRTHYPDGSRASPPDDLDDWHRFVRQVATRYRGRIAAYELWVMAPSPHTYTGTPQTLAAMARIGARVIRQADPRAEIVCPSMGELWQQASLRFLAEFAAVGGYQDCDIAGVKLHSERPGQPPESVLALVQIIERAFHRSGIHLRMWNTGTTHRIALDERLTEQQAIDFATRFFLVGLYARYEREYFYNWGGQKIPIVLQADGGPPTAAARAVQRLQSWLRAGRIQACGSGPASGLPPDTFRCEFLLRRDAHPRAPATCAQIVWTATGEALLPGSRQRRVVQRVDGPSEVLAPGAPLRVDQTPRLVVPEPAAGGPVG